MLLALLLAPPTFAQQAPDSVRTQEGPAQQVHIGVGLQAFPLLGLSAKARLNERLSVQVAGLTLMMFETEGRAAVGARLLFDVLRRDTYNVFFAGGLTLFFTQQTVDVRRSQAPGPLFEFVKEVRADQLYALTFGAEAFLGSRVSLSGEAGAAYVRDGVQDGPFPANNYFLPMLGLGLHYWF